MKIPLTLAVHVTLEGSSSALSFRFVRPAALLVAAGWCRSVPYTMTSVLDPATLFNSAVLQLHVPPRPHSGSPPSPTFRGAQSAQAIGKYAQSERETDVWVQQLVNEGEREVGYYGGYLDVFASHPALLTDSINR